MLGIDDVDCDVPTGTLAALMEFSMGTWGWGVVEVCDKLLIRSLLRNFQSCMQNSHSAGIMIMWGVIFM